MTPGPGASGWRVAAGCVVGLLALCALVVWRSLHLTGGWLFALRVTGVLAVLGLLAAAWLAVREATRPAGGEGASREVLLRVTQGEDGPATELVPNPSSSVDVGAVRRPVALALLAALPLLLVLVLAAPAEVAGAAGTPPAQTPTATATADQPTATAPTPPPQTAPPTPSPPETAPPAPPPPQPAACQVTVRPGDTLWDLTAEMLGPQATPADVARAWPAVYAANRAVVGEDPDRILPGQVLTVPCR